MEYDDVWQNQGTKASMTITCRSWYVYRDCAGEVVREGRWSVSFFPVLAVWLLYRMLTRRNRSADRLKKQLASSFTKAYFNDFTADIQELKGLEPSISAATIFRIPTMWHTLGPKLNQRLFNVKVKPKSYKKVSVSLHRTWADIWVWGRNLLRCKSWLADNA